MSDMAALPGQQRSGRTLKTAVSVLQVLRMVEQRSDGVSPEDVAHILGKSLATANYLLNSLCKEGYAYQDPESGRFMATQSRRVSPASTALRAPQDDVHALEPSDDYPELRLAHERLRDAVDELYGMTRHRSYLATTDFESESIVVQEMRGRQGLPTVPGLQPTIRDEAHSLALGKALLAQRPDLVEPYIETYGLKPFTPRTIVSRQGLLDELEVVRRVGYAVDREEYAEGIWCLAVPIYNEDGAAGAALGISLSKFQAGERQRSLLDALYHVAREVQSEKEVTG